MYKCLPAWHVHEEYKTSPLTYWKQRPYLRKKKHDNSPTTHRFGSCYTMSIVKKNYLKDI